MTAGFDLDAVIAEASGEPFTFTLGGETFTMASPEDCDWQVALHPGDGVPFVAELLGDQFDRFCAHKVPSRALHALLDACQRHYGVTPPESPASPTS